MAHVRDQWFRTGPDGSRVKSARHGVGRRWLTSYADGTGRRHARSFERRADAERYVAEMAADVSRGRYLDPAGGRTVFGDYARGWLASQTFDPSTRAQVELRLRLHTLPTWESVALGAIKPSTVQAWLSGLRSSMAASTARQVFVHFSAILRAAVEDDLIGKNPCTSRAVTRPIVPRRRIVPWERAAVLAVIDAHPARYAALGAVAAGAGLRQGEIFGLAVEDIDFLRRVIHIVRQVKYVPSELIFSAPKYESARDVPLSDGLAVVLAEHIRQFPPVAVTLAWKDPAAVKVRLVTASLIFTSREHKPLNSNYINASIWKPALVAAGVPPTRENGMHALRHFCASNWLEQGVSIRAVAEYLGHRDEAFTLRTYTHFMPSAEDKTRSATDALFVRSKASAAQP
ncbi:MAG: tyrosine-type recombinase/integrase [Mycobacteriales bacterium]